MVYWALVSLFSLKQALDAYLLNVLTVTSTLHWLTPFFGLYNGCINGHLHPALAHSVFRLIQRMY